MTQARADQLCQQLHANGFDRSAVVVDTDPDGEENGEYGVTIRCSSCAAIAVQGIGIHESRCPNERKDVDSYDEENLWEEEEGDEPA